ncbi:DJ-1/PfpI family protein [Actinosynnema mirum]|uniref:ThiJ/PfpI domain protein n=1 Tax=Actinosynnema mirum (strain ATCC 29888 / DSM 43827 / JCM 3225 / NBRC 14064 / NCIMB 13271 / NRRL B-12336 / IMRU 3971 / 101) TaxID=446462 RepID=C6WA36_ACTMD|nr:DJ-1/PfpI family protein [Actinosynnema mirum]ACU39225.1 ThiJ/PfpI domain protein [Actinosynnema mirum DSM 43827]
MHAQFVLFDGFDPLDVIAPYEVLGAGAALGADTAFTVEFASAEGERLVPSGVPGISLRAVAAVDAGRADLVVVPGAVVLTEDDVRRVFGAALATPLAGALATAVGRDGVVVATVCGGSVLLGMAGLLAGRTATTNSGATALLGSLGARAVEARVADDGDLVTAGGVTSGLDLGLHLLDRFLGPDAALAAERLFHHERRGTTWTAR